VDWMMARAARNGGVCRGAGQRPLCPDPSGLHDIPGPGWLGQRCRRERIAKDVRCTYEDAIRSLR
jgi:hypothetical protein